MLCSGAIQGLVTADPSSRGGAHDVTATRYFTFAGSTVALEQAAEGVGDVPLFFLFGDYQGSAQLMMSNEVDPSTATIQRNAYTPYGAVREFDPDGSAGSASANPLTIERGWLSQVADEASTNLGTGLTYLNARYCDPVASRFISPDPMLDVMDPKTLDPYRYAENNPVSYADATGLRAYAGDGVETKNHGTVESQATRAKKAAETVRKSTRMLREMLGAWAATNAPTPPMGTNVGNGIVLDPAVPQSIVDVFLENQPKSDVPLLQAYADKLNSHYRELERLPDNSLRLLKEQEWQQDMNQRMLDDYSDLYRSADFSSAHGHMRDLVEAARGTGDMAVLCGVAGAYFCETIGGLKHAKEIHDDYFDEPD